MMSVAQLTAVCESSIALLFLIVLLLRLWPSLRLDIFRQKMFAVRDELFDYAAAGNISFNDPAYRLLRQSMNGFIRYGHQLTFFGLCMTVLRWKVLQQEPPLTWSSKWDTALSNVSDAEVRDRLIAFHAQSFSLVFDRLVLGSPVLLILTIGAGATMLLQSGWHNVKRVCNQAAMNAVSRIVDPGLLEEEAARSAA